MTGSNAAGPAAADYLCVDAFLTTLVDARALATAFEIGLIEHLQQGLPADPCALAGALGIDAAALDLLLALLRANQVVEDADGNVQLTARFAHALVYRVLLEAKLEWAGIVLADFAEGFNTLLRQPDRFGQSARTRDLFAYDPSPAYDSRTLARTKRWMRLTTCLTRYEAGVCMAHHDFSPYQRIMDIGGNSGELALQICKRYRSVQAAVVDLPVVCDIGEAHVNPHPEANRIRFVRGSAFADDLPRGFDLIVFKSMLHDWPDAAVVPLLEKAVGSLDEGGQS